MINNAAQSKANSQAAIDRDALKAAKALKEAIASLEARVASEIEKATNEGHFYINVPHTLLPKLNLEKLGYTIEGSTIRW